VTNVTAQRKTIACFLSLAKAEEETPVVARLLERLPQGLPPRWAKAPGGFPVGRGRSWPLCVRCRKKLMSSFSMKPRPAHLDEEMRALLREVVHRLFSGRICIILTHDADLASLTSLTDVEIRLDGGRAVRYASARC